MGKYTIVDSDAADLPEVSMYLFTGMWASNERIP
jgi:hypothetical protein